jgi:hypothetical protein
MRAFWRTAPAAAVGDWPAVDPASTHELEFDGALVVKRYRSWDRGEPRREWLALGLLARHAPGLAPEPVRAGSTWARPSASASGACGGCSAASG